MKTLDNLSRDERSLLLFFETCAVDHFGKIKTEHMNADDFKIAERWHKENFVNFGRVAFAGCNEYGTHWCRLSDEAWRLAHEERKARAERTWAKRIWQTTEEKRAS